jgi:magnesium-transporting ATPase (P-type)
MYIDSTYRFILYLFCVIVLLLFCILTSYHIWCFKHKVFSRTSWFSIKNYILVVIVTSWWQKEDKNAISMYHNPDRQNLNECIFHCTSLKQYSNLRLICVCLWCPMHTVLCFSTYRFILYLFCVIVLLLFCILTSYHIWSFKHKVFSRTSWFSIKNYILVVIVTSWWQKEDKNAISMYMTVFDKRP